jgi:hydrogenase-4 component E
MDLTQLTLYQQAVLFTAAFVLFTSFVMLAQGRIVPLIHTFAWQGVLLSLTTVLVAHVTNHPHLYASAAITLVLKALLIPWLLHRLAVRLNIHHESEPLRYPSLTLLGGGALVVFSYYVSLPIAAFSESITRNTIAVSIAVVLLGMQLMIVRKKAIAQVIGFMSIENGLFFAAVAATFGMPMVVELGIAFDVLVAAVLFGVFFFQMRESIDSLDVDRLNRLQEVDEPPLREAVDAPALTTGRTSAASRNSESAHGPRLDSRTESRAMPQGRGGDGLGPIAEGEP